LRPAWRWFVLVAAGLLMKGLVRMYGSDPGVNPHGLVTARVSLSDTKYSDPRGPAHS